MDTTTFELIKTLSELAGPTGDERRVQDWIEDRWRRIDPDVQRTRVDNVLAKVGGSGPKLLLMGHADEICFMVKSIHDDGFLHVWPYYGDLRGHPPRWVMPLNQPALVVTADGLLPGYFATASGHVVGGRDQVANYQWNDWFVQIGANSKAEAEAMGIHPGCRVVWNPPCQRLGEHMVTGKAMDDRAALAIATLAGEALAGRDDLAFEVWLGSTIQEENGLIGAASIMDTLDVDQCINLDVGLTGDIPGVDSRDFPSKLGAGPTVVYQDGSCHYSRRMSDRLVRLARERNQPVQQAIFQNYGSDGASLLRRGAEVSLLAYPTRYTHSPIETVDIRDIQGCVDLIVAYATTPL